MLFAVPSQAAILLKQLDKAQEAAPSKQLQLMVVTESRERVLEYAEAQG